MAMTNNRTMFLPAYIFPSSDIYTEMMQTAKYRSVPLHICMNLHGNFANLCLTRLVKSVVFQGPLRWYRRDPRSTNAMLFVLKF